MANKKPFVTITITPDGAGGYKTAVDEDPYSRAWSQLAQWKIMGVNNLPAGSIVYIQFVDKTPAKAPIDGPLFDGSKKKGKYKSSTSGNSVFIESIVTGPDDGYNYQIGYELGNVQTTLLDPEIVVEGNARLALQFLREVIKAWKLKRRGSKKKKAKAKKAKKAKKR